MTAEAIIALLNGLASAIPAAQAIAADFKVTASAGDVASVDAALSSIMAAAQVQIATAEADLDAAAKAG